MVKTISSVDIAMAFVPTIEEEKLGVILLLFHPSSIKALLICFVLVLGAGDQEKREREW